MVIRIKDIAEKLNISESTVSRALANHPRISAKTKAQVLGIAKKFNYRPNLIAKSLKIRSTKTVGLIIDDITNPFYPEIVKGCEEVANKNGLNIILCNSDYNQEKEDKYINILLSKRVDGVLLMPAGKKLPIIDLFREANTPLVFIDIKPSDKINVSCVYTDQEYGAYIATKYLIELGHKKIALINGPENFSSCKQLESGYLKALSEHNIPLNNKLLKVFDLKSTGAYEVVKNIIKLRKEDCPTAALFISDITAVAAYNAIYEAGLAIPEDFSIIGNDDILTAKNFFPPLTTIAHPKYEIGKKAMEILISELKESKAHSFNQIRYIPELIVRKSSAPPRKT
ncbi:MAG: LacI family DNA-binding transcriptional regulator [Candidatus Humimicrobiaceae bacterium]